MRLQDLTNFSLGNIFLRAHPDKTFFYAANDSKGPVAIFSPYPLIHRTVHKNVLISLAVPLHCFSKLIFSIYFFHCGVTFARIPVYIILKPRTNVQLIYVKEKTVCKSLTLICKIFNTMQRIRIRV